MHNKHTIKINHTIFQREQDEYFEPRYWKNLHAIEGQEKGRGTTWFIRHNEHSLVLRHYYRGGMISRFNRDKYVFTGLNSSRSFKEFNILKELFDAGLPVPEPAAARIVVKGRNYTADLITRRIRGAKDLVQVLQKAPSEELVADIATTVARFHKFGVYHPDLNIQNILVDNAGKVWLIDFDQAKIMPLKTRHRMRMLDRLERSFIKEQFRHKIIWTEKDWLLFDEHYHTAYSRQ